MTRRHVTGFSSVAIALFAALIVAPSLAGAEPLQWHELSYQTTVGPASCVGGSAILDSPRDQVIVFGGNGSTAGQIWTYWRDGLPHWQPEIPQGPLPVARVEHTAIYDRARDRMILHDRRPFLTGRPPSRFQGQASGGR